MVVREVAIDVGDGARFERIERAVLVQIDEGRRACEIAVDRASGERAARRGGIAADVLTRRRVAAARTQRGKTDGNRAGKNSLLHVHREISLALSSSSRSRG